MRIPRPGIGPIRLGTTTTILLTAALIGVLAGIGNIVFVQITEWSRSFFFQFVAHDVLRTHEGGIRGAWIALVPVLGALFLIPLSLSLSGLVNGYGFPRFLAEVHLKKARINPLRLIANTLGAAITIGSGGSAGREGPIAQIGGTIGSIVARWFKLSLKRTQVMVGCGVAGAISATFNAPIAGVLFAEEIVFLGELKLNTFSLFVISSAVATAVSRFYYGHASIFHAPAYRLGSPMELPLYALMGILVGVFAAFYKRSYYAIYQWFNGLKIPAQAKPILGALLVGATGIMMPDILGDGYEVIHQLINGNALRNGIFFLALLAVVKTVATSTTLGSGGAGGLFAPSLFIGAALGACCGQLFTFLFPQLDLSYGAYAVVGMGALLAATTHAPLTSIFLLFEITSGYSVVVPIMIAAIIGTTVSEKLFHDSIDTHYFTLHNIPIEHARERALMEPHAVREVMDPRPFSVAEHLPLPAFLDRVNQSNLTHLPVVDDADMLVGMISLTDLRSFMLREDMWRLLIVSDVMRDDYISLKPEDNLGEAQELFNYHDIEDFPVVDGSGKLCGILTRTRLVNFVRKRLITDRSYETPISDL